MPPARVGHSTDRLDVSPPMVSLTGYAPLSAWHVPLSFQGTMFKGCTSGGYEEAAGEQASSHRTDMPSLPFRPLPISSHPTHCRLVEFPFTFVASPGEDVCSQAPSLPPPCDPHERRDTIAHHHRVIAAGLVAAVLRSNAVRHPRGPDAVHGC